jgi:hypothetical protein
LVGPRVFLRIMCNEGGGGEDGWMDGWMDWNQRKKVKEGMRSERRVDSHNGLSESDSTSLFLSLGSSPPLFIFGRRIFETSPIALLKELSPVS